MTVKMEKRKYVWKEIFWSAVILHLAMFATATNVTTTPSPQQEAAEGSPSRFAWSAWGSWTPCSRTCGGGVSVQERQCLPRTRKTIPEGTLPPPVITVRVTREAHDCPGVAKRYHECNTNSCPGGPRDSRAEQCAAYDRRPFRGRFYTWVPYIDGDSPCMLNCRPLGQQFFASLALVADGTPCTKPGFRAICVQGSCKVVGRESVLAASSSRELQCGRRLVSGLFTKVYLPLGYSYITTIPRGACHLNITEIKPSENYIALKITNSSFLLNGMFAISSPGTYDVAGTRFIYMRTNDQDSVVALGPLQLSIDVMVLYTRPNIDIKYEYLTESLPGKEDVEPVTHLNLPDILSTASSKHSRKHHNFDAYPRSTVSVPRHPDLSMPKENDDEVNEEENVVSIDGRRFLWKILSYSQCTRTCGGGIQVGKYRCVEENGSSNREVASVHCIGSAPAARRRKCGTVPCLPRWRTTAWSTCPECGPASRTRIVGCVQDHSRGITKVSNHKCLTQKPATSEVCKIPNCNTRPVEDFFYTEPKRIGQKEHVTDTFRDVPVYAVSMNDIDTEIGPEYSISATAGWLYTDWSECVGWCFGDGVQTRGVLCADPSGCVPRNVQNTYKSCIPKHTCELHEGQWFTGDWSPCSSPCGGKQVRGVLCIGGTGRHVKDSACKALKPQSERDCEEDCRPTWFYSKWSQCIGNCTTGQGFQSRTVWCSKPGGGAEEYNCDDTKPESRKYCTLHCIVTASTIPPDLTIESQKSAEYEPPLEPTMTATQRNKMRAPEDERCLDKLENCALAVQARLCRYNYYVDKCCLSCGGQQTEQMPNTF